MRSTVFILGIFLSLSTFSSSGAQEIRLKTLKVGSIVYTNVSITSASTTHVYFTHSKGMNSAKLSDVEPGLQQRLGFEPAKAAAALAEQERQNVQYRTSLKNAPVTKPKSAAGADPVGAPDEIPAHTIYAKSVIDQPAPELSVEKWLTTAPNTQGKFVLVDIWATWCQPCKRSIPQLNALQAKFKDRLVVIGISSEPEATIRNMTDPKIDYALGSDTQSRISNTLEVKGIPHALLIDPKGIVRFEGMPQYLSDRALEKLMAKFAL